ncbi:MAG: DUF2336 domain-containing protein [Devosia sp.]|uniref:DUF2336 domain-containing protein n=1 Tax=Devosia sp. TaxID=1871048 RepID=UPI001AC07C20|nr:DUF2336 domain-containing protein [Devosia sp.]MBN9309899.1 DUF2336 domain-containing protein [Devosia sp.]MBN9316551.1 DUF2336 domain-containing protein [Devosia sp.]
MTEMEEGTTKAFSTFRVLNGDSNIVEREQLFRNMAQLYSYVSDRCDDEQVAQYDEVLCQLAELVEAEARAHVAKLLAPLDRAPGNVVVKLANDEIEVAQPLLEFSNVLSDDDLIEIIARQSEAHRVAIAGRQQVTERVGDAIVEHGETDSVIRLVRNTNAELGQQALERIAGRAAQDAALAADLRGRTDIDWKALSSRIDAVGDKVRETIEQIDPRVDPVTVGKVQAVVYNRMRNRAGFSSQEWKVAYNQVKALSDRKQLDERALIRFARFGYGHHTAAALTMLLRVGPEVFVKWLAMQDYVAITVALRALGIQPDLFEAMIASMPWRDLPSQAELQNVRKRFEALSKDEAVGIFELWRTHAFRRRLPNEDSVGAA